MPTLQDVPPRPYTDEETRERLLDHIWAMIDYWNREERRTTARSKLEGLAFSILSALDGSCVGLPGFVVAPRPHPDDEDYLRSQGENWFPRCESEHDLAGVLHEEFYPVGRQNGWIKE